MAEAVDLRAEHAIELLVGLVREERIGQNARPVDDAVDGTPRRANRLDARAHRLCAAHVDHVVGHFGAGLLEARDVLADLAAIENDLRLARELLRGNRDPRGGRPGEEGATQLGVGGGASRLGRLFDQGGSTEQRESRAVLAKGHQRGRGDAAGAARYDDHRAWPNASTGRRNGPVGRGSMANEGALAAGAKRDLDVASSEKQLGHDAIGDDVGRDLGACHVDRLHGGVGPLGRRGLDETREPTAPGTLAGLARCRKVSTGVLKGHEQSCGLALRSSRQGPRGFERRPLNCDRFILRIADEEPLGEDDPRRLAGHLCDGHRVHAERDQAGGDSPSDAALVVDDLDACRSEEAGQYEPRSR